MNQIIKSLNPNIETGIDGIPLNVIKIAANILDSHLVNIMNKELAKHKFWEYSKTALVNLFIYKKGDRDKIKNYRSVSLWRLKSLWENITRLIKSHWGAVTTQST